MIFFIILSKGIAIDRLVGFQDLGTKDDFTTTKLENVLVKKGTKNLASTFSVITAPLENCCLKFANL